LFNAPIQIRASGKVSPPPRSSSFKSGVFSSKTARKKQVGCEWSFSAIDRPARIADLRYPANSFYERRKSR